MDSESSQLASQMSIQMGKFTIPVLVGTLVNWALQGALFVQIYIYFLAFPKDKLFHKLVVVFIVVAEILQTLGDTKDAIRIFGDGYGNPEALELVGWAWFSTPIAGSIIACVGQLFFAWRIFVLSNKLYIPALVAVVTLFQFGAGIWTGVLICRAKTFFQLQFYTLKPPAAWFSATALADLIIVVATAFYVRKRSTTPGFSGTTLSALSRILRVTVETGVLCAVFAIVDLSVFVTYSGNSYHLGVCIWLSKVYSNSIMVILNSRAHIGHGPSDGTNRPTEVVFQSHSSPSSAFQAAVRTTQTTTMDFSPFTQTHNTADEAKREFGMGA